MKVNIRYTVDLEEVLSEMTELYHKSSAKLDEKLNIYGNSLEAAFKESQVEHIIMALEHKLECYHEHQTKIAEVLNILRGYKDIKDGNIKQPPHEQTSEDE
jgi:hypothetical protein|tara:strand:- start:494 stop:796 length:303 start_codon:yes stop_codon:yes gene_type:complete